MFAVLVFAGGAALFAEDNGLTLFLIVAPLIPVAGVAASFGGDADPAHELVTVTPYSSLQLLLLRTFGVLTTSVPVTVLLGLALPGARVARGRLADSRPSRHRPHAGRLATTSAPPRPRPSWRRLVLAVISALPLGDPVEVVEPLMQLVLAAVALVALAVVVAAQPVPRPVWGGTMNNHEHRHADRGRQVLRPHRRARRRLARPRPRHHRAARPERRRQDHDAPDPCDRAGRRPRDRAGAGRGSRHAVGSGPQVRRRLGYVPQETGFPRGFTAFSFIDYMAILKDWSDPTSATRRYAAWSTWSASPTSPPKRVAALSGGQRRRRGARPGDARGPRPARARRTDHRPRPRPARSAPRRARSGRGVGHGPDLDPPDRGRRRALRAGGRAGRRPDPLRRHRRRPGRARPRGGSGWPRSGTRPPRHAWRTGTGRVRNVGDAAPGVELIEPDLEDAYLLLVGEAGTDSELEAVS